MGDYDYDNTNRGVLFTNDRKETDRHPDYKGSINIAGTDYWLSAWIKEGKKGKFMSLALGDRKEARGSAERRGSPRVSAPPKPSPDPDFNDEIPF